MIKLRTKVLSSVDENTIQKWITGTKIIDYVCFAFCLLGAILVYTGHSASTTVFAMCIAFWIARIFIVQTVVSPVLSRGFKCAVALSRALENPSVSGGDERNYLTKMIYDASEDQFSQTLQYMASLLEDAVDNDAAAKLFQIRAQINALQSQINPHFLYNTLEVMRGYALTSGVSEVAEMAEALSAMFRYNISNSEDVCTMEDELENTESYFVVQRYRYGDRFDVHYLFDRDDKKIMRCLIPKLSIQPIVENSIHHGLEEKLGRGTITIRIYATQNRLIVRISDDGVGIEPSRLKALTESIEQGLEYIVSNSADEKAHVALININQRIKLYFGEEYGLSVSSVFGEGTVMQLTLPLQYKE